MSGGAIDLLALVSSAVADAAALATWLPDVMVEDEGGWLTGFAISIVTGSLLGFLGLLCVVLTVLGLPGLWLLLLLAGALQFSDRWLLPEGASTFGPWTLIGAVAAGLLAEFAEFAAGAKGAKQAGASKRGMVGAMVGGIAGAIVGAPFGLLVGAIVGGVAGSALGAIVMEMTLPHQTLEGAMKPAHGAAMGRLKGIAIKLAVTIALWIGLTIAAFV